MTTTHAPRTEARAPVRSRHRMPVGSDPLDVATARQINSVVAIRPASRVVARVHLEADLRSIGLDLLGACEPEELPAEMAAWIENAVAAAVAAVSDRSLSGLVSALEAAVARAPHDVLHRLDQAATRRDAGIE